MNSLYILGLVSYRRKSSKSNLKLTVKQFGLQIWGNHLAVVVALPHMQLLIKCYHCSLFLLFHHSVLTFISFTLGFWQPNCSHCLLFLSYLICIASRGCSSKEYCCNLSFPSSETISSSPVPVLRIKPIVFRGWTPRAFYGFYFFPDIIFLFLSVDPQFLPNCLLIVTSFVGNLILESL